MIIRQLSGGYSPEIEIVLTDRNGNDLQPLTFKAILVSVDGTIPAVSDPDWRSPDAASYPDDGQAIFKWDFTSSNAAAGEFWMWLLPPDNDPQRVTLVRFD